MAGCHENARKPSWSAWVWPASATVRLTRCTRSIRPPARRKEPPAPKRGEVVRRLGELLSRRPRQSFDRLCRGRGLLAACEPDHRRELPADRLLHEEGHADPRVGQRARDLRPEPLAIRAL